MKMIRKSFSLNGLRTEEDTGYGAATESKGISSRGSFSGIGQNQSTSNMIFDPLVLEMELRRQQLLASKGHRSASTFLSPELQQSLMQDLRPSVLGRASSSRSLKSLKSVGSKHSFQQDFTDEGDGTMQLLGILMNRKERSNPSTPRAAAVDTASYLPQSIVDNSDDVSVLSTDDTLISSAITSPLPQSKVSQQSPQSSALNQIQQEKEELAKMIAKLEAENEEIEQQIQRTKSQNNLIRSMSGRDLTQQDKHAQNYLPGEVVEYKRFMKPSAAQTTLPVEKDSTASKRFAGRPKAPLRGSMSDLLALLESEVKQIDQAPAGDSSRELPNMPIDRLQARVNQLTLGVQQSAGVSQVPVGHQTLPHTHDDMEDSESDYSDDSSSDVSTTDRGSNYVGHKSQDPVGNESHSKFMDASEQDAGEWLMAQLVARNNTPNQVTNAPHPVHGNIPSDQASCVSDSTWTHFTIKTNRTPSGRLETPISEYLPTWKTTGQQPDPTPDPPTRFATLNDLRNKETGAPGVIIPSNRESIRAAVASTRGLDPPENRRNISPHRQSPPELPFSGLHSIQPHLRQNAAQSRSADPSDLRRLSHQPSAAVAGVPTHQQDVGTATYQHHTTFNTPVGAFNNESYVESYAADPPAGMPTMVYEEPEVPLVTSHDLPPVISFNSLDGIRDDVSAISTKGKAVNRKTSAATASTDPETTAAGYDHEVESLSEHSDSSSEFSFGEQLLKELEDSDESSLSSTGDNDGDDSSFSTENGSSYDEQGNYGDESRRMGDDAAARKKARKETKDAGHRKPKQDEKPKKSKKERSSDEKRKSKPREERLKSSRSLDNKEKKRSKKDRAKSPEASSRKTKRSSSKSKEEEDEPKSRSRAPTKNRESHVSEKDSKDSRRTPKAAPLLERAKADRERSKDRASKTKRSSSKGDSRSKSRDKSVDSTECARPESERSKDRVSKTKRSSSKGESRASRRSKSRERSVDSTSSLNRSSHTDGGGRRMLKQGSRRRLKDSAESSLMKIVDEKTREKSKAKSIRKSSLSPARGLEKEGFVLEVFQRVATDQGAFHESFSSLQNGGRPSKQPTATKAYLEKSRKKDYLAYTLH